MSAARRRRCIERVRGKLGVSERFARRVPGRHRSTQREAPKAADDEAALTEAVVALAKQFGRYGYRRITALLRAEGWRVNHKRVERIWRAEGLKVPARQPKLFRRHFPHADTIRHAVAHAGEVWASPAGARRHRLREDHRSAGGFAAGGYQSSSLFGRTYSLQWEGRMFEIQMDISAMQKLTEVLSLVDSAFP